MGGVHHPWGMDNEAKSFHGQIIGILREQEARAKTADMCRKFSNAAFYKWKAKFGGLMFRTPNGYAPSRTEHQAEEASRHRCMPNSALPDATAILFSALLASGQIIAQS
jgi:hypothetical protein